MDLDASIESPRLRLWPMSHAFLLDCWCAGDAPGALDAAAAEMQAALAPDWLSEKDLMLIRLGDLRNDPAARPWLLRAMIEKATQQMVGHIGFHTRPDPEYLLAYGPSVVEIGYTVYPPYRRRGFAREATLAMLAWARQQHAVRHFIASVSPQNEPSVRLLQSLGFEPVGGHVDEVDGYEDIYRLGAGQA